MSWLSVQLKTYIHQTDKTQCPFQPSKIRSRQHYRWRAANCGLYTALMAIEKWWILGVPHLLWLGKSVYNGNFPRTRDTHTFCRAFSSGAWSCHYLVCRGLDSNIQTFACDANSLTHYATTATFICSSKIIPCSDNIIIVTSLFVMVTSLYW